ncbi:MAG: (2Fe-2S)-binding protein [Synechococcaceae bacterium WBB_34_004]|nr:(2Fe-2S)-binding protein [Synechococcaceae bacterium WB7_1C_051]NDG03709.1 (2Fe-2S)-binding protein [Synechococcaceae bacterium WBB_34_004]
MAVKTIKIHWPNAKVSEAKAGDHWLAAAKSAGISIPTGCLGGSCGACEIDVNGETVRACISSVPSHSNNLEVELSSDPHW